MGTKYINKRGIDHKKSWVFLVMSWTQQPTLYQTTNDYYVYEYTYGTTKYYRRVYKNYSPQTDVFYTTPQLTTPIASRALSI